MWLRGGLHGGGLDQICWLRMGGLAMLLENGWIELVEEVGD